MKTTASLVPTIQPNSPGAPSTSRWRRLLQVFLRPARPTEKAPPRFSALPDSSPVVVARTAPSSWKSVPGLQVEETTGYFPYVTYILTGTPAAVDEGIDCIAANYPPQGYGGERVHPLTLADGRLRVRYQRARSCD